MTQAIAIVGMACRFPGAADLRAFWRLLCEGKDAITTVPADRWDVDAFFDADQKAAGKMNSRWGGFLGGIDLLDAEFFGIAPREADVMDPQQRLMMELAWECLEDAAVAPRTLAGKNVGVFVGVGSHNYAMYMLNRNDAINAYSNSGGSTSIVANRISYFLDLRGPSMAIDTACSSSLAAIHQACQSMQSGDCQAALVGGVNVILAPGSSISAAKAGTLSPDGRCRVYDADANGQVRSEGAGVVLLKPLESAVADGDRVYAVIRGSAVNQDGRTTGLMAPNRWAQEAVLREAYRRADISPGRVRYIEGHSVGTPLGDATELNALAAVLKTDRDTDASAKCFLGSVKSNIGHLEAAAGIAGLIKTALMLQHRQLVPSPHYQRPNPHVPFAQMPLEMATMNCPWPQSDAPAIAGVSGSGFGGLNVHVVLEEFPAQSITLNSSQRSDLFTLSARNEKALRELAQKYIALLDGSSDRLMDICFTAAVGRHLFDHRLAIVCQTVPDLRERLQAYVDGREDGWLAGRARRGVKPMPAQRADVDRTTLLESLARGFVEGSADPLAAFANATCAPRRIELPSYPFQRERYWVDGGIPQTPSALPAAPQKVSAGQSNEDFSNLVFREAARAMGHPIERLPPDVPLTSLGLDSLMAMDLKNAIDRQLGTSLAVSDLLSGTTLAELQQRVNAARRDQPSVPSQAPATVPTAPSKQADIVEYPTSYGQRALWFLYRFDPSATAYNVAVPIRISANVDPAAFEAACQALVELHPVLRTTYGSGDGEPVQRVHRTGHAPFEHVDATQLTREQLEARMAAEAHRTFDLETGPVFRVHLFRTAPAENLLMVVAHHIAIDFWSVQIMLDDLARLYKQRRTGNHADSIPATLHSGSLQYVDYVRDQIAWVASPAGDACWKYWQQKLRGELPTLQLPTDRPRPAVQSFRGASVPMTFSPELTQSLTDLARRQGTTLYVILLAAFKVLLHRYTGQRDLLVGSPAFGRTKPGFERVIGYFASPIVLRSEISGSLTFSQFARQVRDTVNEALEHQDYPLELLATRLLRRRDPAKPPLFQVMFSLNRPHLIESRNAQNGAAADDNDLPMTPAALSDRAAMFDLMLGVRLFKGALWASWQYNTDILDAQSTSRMARHYHRLLHAIIESADVDIADLALLEEEERQQLPADPGATTSGDSIDRCVHELFEQQAARTPDAIAIRSHRQTLTYAQLEARANHLAAHLISLGAGPEARIAICVPRSPEQIAAVLAILKSGAAYVPLDPQHPPERLKFLLEDSQALVLIATAELHWQVTQTAGIPIVELDAFNHDLLVTSPRTLGVGSPNALAYVMYTSGSTGAPKGVAVEHRSVVNYALAAGRLFELTPSDRLLQFASLAFDGSVEEIFTTLALGATLVLRSELAKVSVPQLLADCARDGVTVLDLPTAFFHELVSAMQNGHRLPSCIRLVVIGGEALSPARLAGWRGVVGSDVRLLNGYGPTETTVVATFCDLTHATAADASERVAIGKPIANVQCYVVDERGKPAPMGVPGELWISGVGVARGYLNRPDLTAEKFIANPFDPSGRSRVYRSGDRVRYRNDGNLEFWDRLDGQVKVRGFRIEVGEIEAALCKHPGIAEAAVLCTSGPDGDARLAAYFSPLSQAAPQPDELREFLAQSLPEHMLPWSYVGLERLPRNVAGKLERSLLPAGDAPPQLKRQIKLPYFPLQKRLAQIWRELLGVEEIGIQDSFFELGGHSLLTLRLIERISAEWGKPLPVATLFSHPTIQGLGDFLEDRLPKAESSTLVPIRTRGSKPPFIFLHGDFIGGGLYCYKMGQMLPEDQPFYLLHPHGFDGGVIPPTIEAMAADHLERLEAAGIKGPYRLGGFCNGATIAAEMARQLRVRGELVDRLILVEAPRANTRLRPIFSVVRAIGNATGIKWEIQRRVLRQLWIGAEAGEFRAVSRAALGAIRKAQNKARMMLAGSATNGHSNGNGHAPAPAGASPILINRSRSAAEVITAVATHIPSPYPGTVHLVWSSDGPSRNGTDRTNGWNRVARDTVTRWCAGTHNDCLTDNLNDLTRQVKACLEDTSEHAHPSR